MSQPRLRGNIGKKMMLAVALILGAYIVWVAAWSRQGSTLSAVRLGVDRCHHCGMIVSELRFAVSVLDRDEQGHVVTRHFDDPGCFQEFAKAHPGSHFTGVAHDFRDGSELPLEQAQFKKTDIATPMGSGVVAERAAAE